MPEYTSFALACIVDMVESDSTSDRPPQPDLLPVGTRVESDMRGRPTGVIVGYNGSAGPFYGADRYPYRIQWCDGYTGCYHVTEAGISVVN